MKRQRKRRKRKNRYHTGTHVAPKLMNKCDYRSGYERKYLEILDLDENVVQYFYEPVRIEYVSNVRTCKLRHYVPDFLVVTRDGQKLLVEVKPLRKLKNLIVQKKIKAGERWCLENGAKFVVLTEVDLKRMGAIM